MDVGTSDRTFTVTPLDEEVELFFREFFFPTSDGLDGILEEL
jgi:hypothetical protein